MPVKVKIVEYLGDLRLSQEGMPPSQRKAIPTVTEFANAAQVTRQTMHGFIFREEHKLLNLHLLSSILSLLRGYGHGTQLTDLLEYTED